MDVGPGTELAGYRVKHTLGEGGMAIVYLAERVSDGEQVVFKVLREELAGDEPARRRFLRESRYARALDHPGVVQILDSGECGDVLYIAMQHIAGTDLYALLEEGPLEPATTIAMLAQVADALDVAHEIGLLHRDVKPGNVLVAVGGDDEPARCFLTDFGLSQQISHDSMALTAPGTFVGTLAYMAPEQMLGDDPGVPVDVYALGCVLFECLAGDPPFTGPPMTVMQSHIESPPPKLAKAGSGFPRALDTVISRALAKDPGERYETCTELVQAAAAALEVVLPTVHPSEPDTAAVRPPAQDGSAPGGGPSRQEASGPLELIVAASGTPIEVEGELLIGRGQPGHRSLGGDPELSRRHALVGRAVDGSLTIEDLGSLNGTYLNGRRIEDRELVRPGDEIAVGGQILMAVAGPAVDGEPSRAPDADVISRTLVVPGVSLRITFAPEAGVATLQLDEASEPIALEHRAGVWRLAAP